MGLGNIGETSFGAQGPAGGDIKKNLDAFLELDTSGEASGIEHGRQVFLHTEHERVYKPSVHLLMYIRL